MKSTGSLKKWKVFSHGFITSLKTVFTECNVFICALGHSIVKKLVVYIQGTVLLAEKVKLIVNCCKVGTPFNLDQNMNTRMYPKVIFLKIGQSPYCNL